MTGISPRAYSAVRLRQEYSRDATSTCLRPERSNVCEFASAAAIVGLLKLSVDGLHPGDKEVVCIPVGTDLRPPDLDSFLNLGSLAEDHAEFLERPAR